MNTAGNIIAVAFPRSQRRPDDQTATERTQTGTLSRLVSPGYAPVYRSLDFRIRREPGADPDVNAPDTADPTVLPRPAQMPLPRHGPEDPTHNRIFVGGRYRPNYGLTTVCSLALLFPATGSAGNEEVTFAVLVSVPVAVVVTTIVTTAVAPLGMAPSRQSKVPLK